MIVLHAASSVAAFAVGLVALLPDRVRERRWLPSMLAWLLGGSVLFMVGATAAHWSDLAGGAHLVFPGLAVLALYMLYRALHARRAAGQLTGSRQARSMDDIGFILVALFNGFVIVSAIDLGASFLMVIPLAVLAAVLGHLAVARAKVNAGLTGHPPRLP